MKKSKFEKLVEEKSFIQKHKGHDIVFLEDEKQGGYTCWMKQYPGIIAEGDTLNEAAENIIKTYEMVKEEGLLNELEK